MSVQDLTAMLLSSEEQYIGLMTGLLEGYVRPIVAAYSGNAVALALGRALQEICANNASFLESLRVGASTGSVCEAFCERGTPTLMSHIAFAQQYHAFMTLLETVDPALMRKLDTDPATLAACHGLTVDQLLTAPLDRVVAYFMMLSNMAMLMAGSGVRDELHAVRAREGLSSVCAMVMEKEGSGLIQSLSAGLGVPLQYSPARCFLVEGGFDFTLHVLPHAPDAAPAPWDDAAAIAAVAMPDKTVRVRTPGRAWLFNDCVVVAVEGDGYEYRTTVPLGGGCTVTRKYADVNAPGSARAMQQIIVTGPPQGAADLTVGGTQLPLSPSDTVPVVAPGERFQLILWPYRDDGGEHMKRSSVASSAGPESSKIGTWMDDLTRVATGEATDPLLPRYRSISAREQQIQAYQVTMTTSDGAAEGSGMRGVGGGGVGGGSGAGVGGASSSPSMEDVLRSIADIQHVPMSVYDNAAFASEAEVSSMYSLVVEGSIGKGLLREGRVEKRSGGLMARWNSRYLLVRVTTCDVDGLEGEFQLYDSAVDAAKGVGLGKDSFPLSAFTKATYLNEAGGDKNRGLFEVEFGSVRMSLKADTDAEAQSWVLMLGCYSALCARFQASSSKLATVKQQRAQAAAVNSSDAFLAASSAVDKRELAAAGEAERKRGRLARGGSGEEGSTIPSPATGSDGVGTASRSESPGPDGPRAGILGRIKRLIGPSAGSSGGATPPTPHADVAGGEGVTQHPTPGAPAPATASPQATKADDAARQASNRSLLLQTVREVDERLVDAELESARSSLTPDTTMSGFSRTSFTDAALVPPSATKPTTRSVADLRAGISGSGRNLLGMMMGEGAMTPRPPITSLTRTLPLGEVGTPAKPRSPSVALFGSSGAGDASARSRGDSIHGGMMEASPATATRPPSMDTRRAGADGGGADGPATLLQAARSGALSGTSAPTTAATTLASPSSPTHTATGAAATSAPSATAAGDATTSATGAGAGPSSKPVVNRYGTVARSSSGSCSTTSGPLASASTLPSLMRSQTVSVQGGNRKSTLPRPRGSLVPRRVTVFDLAARLGGGGATAASSTALPTLHEATTTAVANASYFNQSSLMLPPATSATSASGLDGAGVQGWTPGMDGLPPAGGSPAADAACVFASHVIPRKMGGPTPRASLVSSFSASDDVDGSSAAPAPSSSVSQPVLSPSATSVALPPGTTPRNIVAAVCYRPLALGARRGSIDVRLAIPAVPVSVFDDLEAEVRGLQSASAGVEGGPLGSAAADAARVPNAQWLRALTPAAAVAVLRHGGPPSCLPMLQLYASRGQSHSAGEFLFFMRQAGVDASSPAGLALYIKALCRAGRYSHAEEAYTALPPAVIAADTSSSLSLALLEGLAEGGAYDRIHAHLSTWAAHAPMPSASPLPVPTLTTAHWNCLITAAGKHGAVDLATEMVRVWLLCWSALPRVEDRDDAIVAARQLGLTFPVPPDVSTVNALIQACGEGGDVLRARLVFEALVSADLRHGQAGGIFVPAASTPSMPLRAWAVGAQPAGSDTTTLTFLHQGVHAMRAIHARGDVTALRAAYGTPAAPANPPPSPVVAYTQTPATPPATLSRATLLATLSTTSVRRWTVYDAIVMATERTLTRADMAVVSPPPTKLAADVGSYVALLHAYSCPGTASPTLARSIMALLQARCMVERMSTQVGGGFTPALSSAASRYRISASASDFLMAGGGRSGRGMDAAITPAAGAATGHEGTGWVVPPAAYDRLIAANALAGDLEGSKEALSAMGKAGLAPTPETYAYVLTALGKAGRIHEARAVFEAQQDSDAADDVASYNAMIRALVDDAAAATLRALLSDAPPSDRADDDEEERCAASASRRQELLHRAQVAWALLQDMTSSVVELQPNAGTYEAMMSVVSTLALLLENEPIVDGDGLPTAVALPGKRGSLAAFTAGLDLAAVQPVLQHMVDHRVPPTSSLITTLCGMGWGGPGCASPSTARLRMLLPVIKQVAQTEAATGAGGAALRGRAGAAFIRALAAGGGPHLVESEDLLVKWVACGAGSGSRTSAVGVLLPADEVAAVYAALAHAHAAVPGHRDHATAACEAMAADSTIQACFRVPERDTATAPAVTELTEGRAVEQVRMWLGEGQVEVLGGRVGGCGMGGDTASSAPATWRLHPQVGAVFKARRVVARTLAHVISAHAAAVGACFVGLHPTPGPTSTQRHGHGASVPLPTAVAHALAALNGFATAMTSNHAAAWSLLRQVLRDDAMAALSTPSASTPGLDALWMGLPVAVAADIHTLNRVLTMPLEACVTAVARLPSVPRPIADAVVAATLSTCNKLQVPPSVFVVAPLVTAITVAGAGGAVEATLATLHQLAVAQVHRRFDPMATTSGTDVPRTALPDAVATAYCNLLLVHPDVVHGRLTAAVAAGLGPRVLTVWHAYRNHLAAVLASLQAAAAATTAAPTTPWQGPVMDFVRWRLMTVEQLTPPALQEHYLACLLRVTSAVAGTSWTSTTTLSLADPAGVVDDATAATLAVPATLFPHPMPTTPARPPRPSLDTILNAVAMPPSSHSPGPTWAPGWRGGRGGAPALPSLLPTSRLVPGVMRQESLSPRLVLHTVRGHIVAACYAGLPITITTLSLLVQLYSLAGLMADARLLCRLLLAQVYGREYGNAELSRDVAADTVALYTTLHAALRRRAAAGASSSSTFPPLAHVHGDRDASTAELRLVRADGPVPPATRAGAPTVTWVAGGVPDGEAESLFQSYVDALLAAFASGTVAPPPPPTAPDSGEGDGTFSAGNAAVAPLAMTPSTFCHIITALAAAGMGADDVEAVVAHAYDLGASQLAAHPTARCMELNASCAAVVYTALQALRAGDRAEGVLSDGRFHWGPATRVGDAARDQPPLFAVPVPVERDWFAPTRLGGVATTCLHLGSVWGVGGGGDSVHCLNHAIAAVNTSRIVGLVAGGDVHAAVRLVEHHVKVWAHNPGGGHGLWGDITPAAITAVLQGVASLSHAQLCRDPADDAPMSSAQAPYVAAQALLSGMVGCVDVADATAGLAALGGRRRNDGASTVATWRGVGRGSVVGRVLLLLSDLLKAPQTGATPATTTASPSASQPLWHPTLEDVDAVAKVCIKAGWHASALLVLWGWVDGVLASAAAAAATTPALPATVMTGRHAALPISTSLLGPGGMATTLSHSPSLPATSHASPRAPRPSTVAMADFSDLEVVKDELLETLVSSLTTPAVGAHGAAAAVPMTVDDHAKGLGYHQQDGHHAVILAALSAIHASRSAPALSAASAAISAALLQTLLLAYVTAPIAMYTHSHINTSTLTTVLAVYQAVGVALDRVGRGMLKVLAYRITHAGGWPSVRMLAALDAGANGASVAVATTAPPAAAPSPSALPDTADLAWLASWYAEHGDVVGEGEGAGPTASASLEGKRDAPPPPSAFASAIRSHVGGTTTSMLDYGVVTLDAIAAPAGEDGVGVLALHPNPSGEAGPEDSSSRVKAYLASGQPSHRLSTRSDRALPHAASPSARLWDAGSIITAAVRHGVVFGLSPQPWWLHLTTMAASGLAPDMQHRNGAALCCPLPRSWAQVQAVMPAVPTPSIRAGGGGGSPEYHRCRATSLVHMLTPPCAPVAPAYRLPRHILISALRSVGFHTDGPTVDARAVRGVDMDAAAIHAAANRLHQVPLRPATTVPRRVEAIAAAAAARGRSQQSAAAVAEGLVAAGVPFLTQDAAMLGAVAGTPSGATAWAPAQRHAQATTTHDGGASTAPGSQALLAAGVLPSASAWLVAGAGSSGGGGGHVHTEAAARDVTAALVEQTKRVETEVLVLQVELEETNQSTRAALAEVSALQQGDSASGFRLPPPLAAQVAEVERGLNATSASQHRIGDASADAQVALRMIVDASGAAAPSPADDSRHTPRGTGFAPLSAAMEARRDMLRRALGELASQEVELANKVSAHPTASTMYVRYATRWKAGMAEETDVKEALQLRTRASRALERQLDGYAAALTEAEGVVREEEQAGAEAAAEAARLAADSYNSVVAGRTLVQPSSRLIAARATVARLSHLVLGPAAVSIVRAQTHRLKHSAREALQAAREQQEASSEASLAAALALSKRLEVGVDRSRQQVASVTGAVAALDAALAELRVDEVALTSRVAALRSAATAMETERETRPAGSLFAAATTLVHQHRLKAEAAAARAAVDRRVALSRRLELAVAEVRVAGEDKLAAVRRECTKAAEDVAMEVRHKCDAAEAKLKATMTTELGPVHTAAQSRLHTMAMRKGQLEAETSGVEEEIRALAMINASLHHAVADHRTGGDTYARATGLIGGAWLPSQAEGGGGGIGSGAAGGSGASRLALLDIGSVGESELAPEVDVASLMDDLMPDRDAAMAVLAELEAVAEAEAFGGVGKLGTLHPAGFMRLMQLYEAEAERLRLVHPARGGGVKESKAQDEAVSAVVAAMMSSPTPPPPSARSQRSPAAHPAPGPARQVGASPIRRTLAHAAPPSTLGLGSAAASPGKWVIAMSSHPTPARGVPPAPGTGKEATLLESTTPESARMARSIVAPNRERSRSRGRPLASRHGGGAVVTAGGSGAAPTPAVRDAWLSPTTARGGIGNRRPL